MINKDHYGDLISTSSMTVSATFFTRPPLTTCCDARCLATTSLSVCLICSRNRCDWLTASEEESSTCSDSDGPKEEEEEEEQQQQQQQQLVNNNEAESYSA